MAARQRLQPGCSKIPVMHRSLFFGCDQVNGGNFWQDTLERGQAISKGPKVAEATKRSAVIVNECEWQRPGQPVQMTDERKFILTMTSPRLRILDVEIKWSAAVDVTIQKTNHALFAIRAANDITPWGGGRPCSKRLPTPLPKL